MRELPHTRSCFVCGEANAAGLKLRFVSDGKNVRAQFVPRAEHVGFSQVVHGGLIATVLDEIMVWACAVQTKRFAFCAELKVRFISPLRPGQPVTASGELTSNRRGKIFEARAEIKDQAGVVLAVASGKYLPISQGDAAKMAADFVGDPGWIFQ